MTPALHIAAVAAATLLYVASAALLARYIAERLRPSIDHEGGEAGQGHNQDHGELNR